MAKTLIVDDEPDLVETCARLLEQAGHTCLTTDSGREALRLIDEERPNLVVTDLRLPRVDGLAVARHARLAAVPVVLITAYTSPQARREARAAGAAVFLPKPFSAVEFLDAVDRALAHAGC